MSEGIQSGRFGSPKKTKTQNTLKYTCLRKIITLKRSKSDKLPLVAALFNFLAQEVRAHLPSMSSFFMALRTLAVLAPRVTVVHLMGVMDKCLMDTRPLETPEVGPSRRTWRDTCIVFMSKRTNDEDYTCGCVSNAIMIVVYMCVCVHAHLCTRIFVSSNDNFDSLFLFLSRVV